MKLIQGLMCAISAGMLIYAACVEMLAGDFVMDAVLWRSSIWKQALAMMSLLIGAAAMAVIGYVKFYSESCFDLNFSNALSSSWIACKLSFWQFDI